MSSGPKTTSSTQTNEPPAYVKPYLEQAAGEAQSIYENPEFQQIYQGPYFAPFSSQTQQALDLMLSLIHI